MGPVRLREHQLVMFLVHLYSPIARMVDYYLCDYNTEVQTTRRNNVRS